MAINFECSDQDKPNAKEAEALLMEWANDPNKWTGSSELRDKMLALGWIYGLRGQYWMVYVGDRLANAPLH